MRLDKHIKDFKVLTPFSTMKEIEPYIGKECYFADHLADFKSLEQYCKKAVLDRCIFGDYNENRYPFRINDNTEDADDFGFCLPCDFIKDVVEEKPLKYRPYTVKEFKKQFQIGDVILYRFINDESDALQYRFLYLGDKTLEDNFIVYFGTESYTLSKLFNRFEWFDKITDSWKPFGEVDGK